ncbi:MAG: type II secretion system F family protein [Burkholderiales bacterium]|nr:type II secretion system F family protein [Burkholderiales bacterium]
MALFSYRAMNPRGKTVSGNLDAMNIVDLELRLKRLDLDLITHGLANRRVFFRGRRVKRPELITFCFHLEQLMRSGVPILEALADLRDTVNDNVFRAVIANLVESIEGGLSLSDAMAQHPDTFDVIYVSLVKAGEQSGQLPEVLEKLSENLKWQDEIAAQTKKILLYPAFMGSIILVAIGIMMGKIVPDLVGVIKTLTPELPLQTRILIVISNFFRYYWYVLIIVPAASFVALKTLLKVSPAACLRLDAIKLKLPFIGPILHKLIMTRFATFFAMMYAAKINILECLQAAEKMAGNRVVEEGLQRVGRQIAEGKGVSQAFATVQLFPPLVLRMLRVGETTGALDRALANVSYFYNREVKESIARAQSIIEPTLTLVLGVIFGWVALSMLGPVWSVIGGVKF